SVLLESPSLPTIRVTSLHLCTLSEMRTSCQSPAPTSIATTSTTSTTTRTLPGLPDPSLGFSRSSAPGGAWTCWNSCIRMWNRITLAGVLYPMNM
ncbi:hypothetical protein GOODEAATRI_034314, partial [Goodea atripinnis]